MSMWRVGRWAAAADGGFTVQVDDVLPGFRGVVDKVVKWVPGDILALYAAGVVAFDVAEPRSWLLIAAVIAAPIFLRLGAFSVGGPWGGKEKTAAFLSVPATALWIGSVPGNGWLTIGWIKDHQKPAAWVFLVLAGIFSLVADGLTRAKSP